MRSLTRKKLISPFQFLGGHSLQQGRVQVGQVSPVPFSDGRRRQRGGRCRFSRRISYIVTRGDSVGRNWIGISGRSRRDKLRKQGVGGIGRANQGLRNRYKLGLSCSIPSFRQLSEVTRILAVGRAPFGPRPMSLPRGSSALPQPIVFSRAVHRRYGNVRCPRTAWTIAHLGSLGQVRL